MSFTVLCTIVIFFYVAIWFFDSFFKSCMHYPYYAFLEGTGFKVGLLHFTWTTTAFNRFIFRVSHSFDVFFRRWYKAGLNITIFVFLPFCILTLLSIIYEHFNDTIALSNGPELQAIIPGVNVPSSDFLVYFVSLAFSSIVHEFGHAIAANNEHVQVISVGICIVTIIPVAFVQLNNNHMHELSPLRRLRIYSAGIWHNLICAFLALLLYYSTPSIFNFGYESNVGVRVTGFTQNLPFMQTHRGMAKEDVIVAINGCRINNMRDYTYCVKRASERFGICISREFIARYDEVITETVKDNDVVDCCSKDEKQLRLCFEYIEPKNPGDSTLMSQYSCLKPREMLNEDFDICWEYSGYTCQPNRHCLKPSLPNTTHFMMIERKNRLTILYLGSPLDLYAINVDQYFPRVSLFTSFTPMQFEKLMRYVFLFSMGIAFINIMPCYGMDGHHMARTMIEICARRFNKREEFVVFFTVFTLVIGTCMTLPIMFYLFFKVIVLEGHTV